MFLDMDGCVLPFPHSYKSGDDDYPIQFHPIALKFLNKIIDEYNPTIVFTFNWRFRNFHLKHSENIAELNRMIRSRGGKFEITHMTGIDSEYGRCDEIQQWMAKNKFDKSIPHIIIDDVESIKDEFPDNAVWCDPTKCFGKSEYDLAVSILSR